MLELRANNERNFTSLYSYRASRANFDRTCLWIAESWPRMSCGSSQSAIMEAHKWPTNCAAVSFAMRVTAVFHPSRFAHFLVCPLLFYNSRITWPIVWLFAAAWKTLKMKNLWIIRHLHGRRSMFSFVFICVYILTCKLKQSGNVVGCCKAPPLLFLTCGAGIFIPIMTLRCILLEYRTPE